MEAPWNRGMMMMMMPTIYALLAVILTLITFTTCAEVPTPTGSEASSWEDVWSYDGLQGPNFWARMYSAWHLCENGQRQSPIEINADTLLYDPNLKNLEIESPLETSGVVNNTGRGLSFFPRERNVTFISHGPLSYRYRLAEIRLHFGIHDMEGSEHTVGGRAFPGELQLIFINDDLYDSYAQAEKSPHGLAIIALFIKEGNQTSRELSRLTEITVLSRLVYKANEVNITGLSIPLLLPETKEFMTYEGSTTTPMCSETVTWIVFNRPAYLTHYQLETLREMLKTKRGVRPASRLLRNFRPPQKIGTRTVRTNIVQKYTGAKDCPQHRREYFYKTLISRR